MSSLLCGLYADAEAVRVAAGRLPGVEAGILSAFTSAGGLTFGLFISSRVTPVSIFVRPMTGGSPFFTNSYSPGPDINLQLSDHKWRGEEL